MSTQTIIGVATPIILAILMWGVGLTVQVEDFRRVLTNRPMLFLALLVQLLIIPLFAVFLNRTFQLPAELAIGLLLLASTPSGVTANVLSLVARGNLALNVSITAINTLISAFSIPLMVYIAYSLYQEKGVTIPLQFSKLGEVFAIMFIPICIGIYTRKKFPQKALKLENFISKLSFFTLLFFLGAALYQEAQTVRDHFRTVGIPVLLLNLFALTIAFFSASYLRLKKADRSALIMEFGIHNCILALGIAMSPHLLNSVPASVPAAFYAVTMYFTGIPLALWFRWQSDK